MASLAAVTRAVKALSECFPHRTVTPNTVPVYALALNDVDDETLNRAVRRAMVELKFFPVPAELRELAGANRIAAPDVDAICRELWGMVDQSRGLTFPRAEAVRERFGDSVAEAYGYVGPHRLFASHETTVTIARRDFAETLAQAMRARGEKALPAPAPLQLPPYTGPVIDGAPTRPQLAPVRAGTALAALSLARSTEDPAA